LGKRGEGGRGRAGCDTPQRVAEQPGQIDAILLVEFFNARSACLACQMSRMTGTSINISW